MQQKGVQPNSITFVGVACANMVVFEVPKGVHRIIQNDLESNAIMGNSLLDMYAKYVIKMLSQDKITWTTMMLGHVKCEQGKKNIELF
jgi:hypothetical protein